eukprot:Gb_26576 [translate_table: standard]
MPYLVAVIYMDALSPPKWMCPSESPRLKAYSQLHRKKAAEKDKKLDSYLSRFYIALQQLNDGPEASKKLLEYIKKQWKEALWVEDGRVRYLSCIPAKEAGVGKKVPVWPHPSWIKGPKSTIGLSTRNISPSNSWSPPHLPIIPLPEIQRKEKATEKEKKKKSMPKVPESQKRKRPDENLGQETSEEKNRKHKPEDTEEEGLHKENQRGPNPQPTITVFTTTPLSVNLINTASPLSSPPPITQIPLFLWSHDAVGTDPSIDPTFDIVPPPSLQKVREKRKARFIPTIQVLDNTVVTPFARDLISKSVHELAMRVEELERELVLQAHCFREENESLNQSLSILTREIGELGVAPTTEQATLATKMPLSIRLLVHLLKQAALKAKVASLVPPEIQIKLSQLELEVEFRMTHATERRPILVQALIPLSLGYLESNDPQPTSTRETSKLQGNAPSGGQE